MKKEERELEIQSRQNCQRGGNDIKSISERYHSSYSSMDDLHSYSIYKISSLHSNTMILNLTTTKLEQTLSMIACLPSPKQGNLHLAQATVRSGERFVLLRTKLYEPTNRTSKPGNSLNRSIASQPATQSTKS